MTQHKESNHSNSCRSSVVGMGGCYVVIFIDLLGVSSILLDIGDNEQRLNRFANKCDSLFDMIQSEALAIGDGRSFVRGFSDCYVLARPWCLNERCLSLNQAWLVRRLARLQSDAIRQGFLMRGGIALGGLSVTDTTIMGDGLVRAYELESKKAIVPRIVIDPELVSSFRLDKQGIIEDEDGFFFIDFIGYMIAQHDFAEFHDCLRKMANAIIAQHSQNKRKTQKGIWLLSYLERILADSKIDLSKTNEKNLDI